MAAGAGGAFDPLLNEALKAVVVDRLRRGPGPAARRALAAPPAGPPPSRWSRRALQATFPWWEALTLSGVWRALRRLGLGLRAAAVPRYSPDPDYLAKEARLLACLQAAAAAPDEVAALFVDEMGSARWPAPGAGRGPGAPAPRPGAGRAGSKQQLWRVLGARDALTGQGDYLDDYVIGREKGSAFYRQVDQRYASLRRRYVIQDNWSIHRHADVLATLETLPRIEPVWLPTYAPWLNPIEQLWRWLKEQVLKVRKQHRLAGDRPALRRRVRVFLDQLTTGGSTAGHVLLQYVGLLGEGKLAQACRAA